SKPSLHELPGTVCVGHTAEGAACRENLDMDGSCLEPVCRAQWFVSCVTDPATTGNAQGYCVDRRFSDAGAAACYTATNDFEGQCNLEGQSCNDYNANQRLANCNSDANDTSFTAAECCQESLGGEDINPDEEGLQCDPLFQSELRPVARYDRNENLPDQTRACVCRRLDDMDESELDLCGRTVADVCYSGDDFLEEREGEYAVKFILRRGGVVYDPAIKGIEWRPADIGGIPRAKIETCAQDRGIIGDRNRHEGWLANDAFTNQVENFEDFDRAMCSGQEYTVQFGVPGDEDGQFIEDKVGNSMEGHSEYTFTTTQFHVVPGSGFPTDNLRIGACDDFSIRFSNKYDMSPENQRKIELYLLDPGDDEDDSADDFITNTEANAGCGRIVPIAGGQDCVATKAEIDVDGDGQFDPCLSPCLTVDVAEQASGEINVQIDPTVFGPILKVGSRYRMSVFGLQELDEMSDEDAYYDAFWDACGMPLVQEDAAPYTYDFTIDTPKCKEDADRDTIQLSCDNAPKNFNPDQLDLDLDGVGDVIDLCPTVASTNNSADSDKDGVGNDCDVCRQTTTQYNMHDNSVSVMDFMFVRNIPWQVDTDDDGIGDVCDNCVQVANCDGFGPDNPYQVGDAIAYDDRSRCQTDADEDLVGNACQDDEADGAAGPVGVGPTDDFDQDGIANSQDACPRQPVAPVACTMGGDECGANADCEGTVCDHVDTDNDGVGDICDTCPFTANTDQIMDGPAQEEDEDGDFVGKVCETNAQCATKADPRPFAFYRVSSNGLCCTVDLVEDGMGNLVIAATDQPLVDPDGLPISVDCDEGDDPELRTCRKLPSDVASAPGILTMPTGCDEALAAAGITLDENTRLTVDEAGGTLDDLWQNFCFLPQTDQDFDSFGEPCDLCPFQFDPDNTSFVDANGRAWPQHGKYCNGDYAPDAICAAQDDSEGESGGTAGESGGTGGTGAGTGGSGGIDTGGTAGG
ncbi:MAG TPA: thrombospondin type 3 repeat-containing protein, partial [Nannocystaceae bacterium]|nr:thrombospondin type 3 repeat-containing protein [Nannocystaceae bacterium]